MFEAFNNLTPNGFENKVEDFQTTRQFYPVALLRF